ncbi:hypothetical protein ANN_26770 [Periplaneta americana]|uniref:DUF4817 domain-containing protein n=1 Tax=Periplaneta americana TaxID=6978 RepID=A0ABQ8RYZ2_PERAM|nr:hypothetical protein ANN_26770 [Periplaneta americana]
MYGKADGNAALARRLYQERYPQRQCPDRKAFVVRLHYRLCEYGKFNSPGLGGGRPRSKTPEVQEEILEAVNMTLSIGTRRVALQVNVPHTTVWRQLKEYQFYPYLQRVRVLSPADYPARVRFYEAQFTRDGGITNFHNQHVWAYENPRATVPSHHQVRFSLNMWAGIIGDRLGGPHVLVNRLTGQAYTNFLENTIPHVLEDTSLINRQHIHFLHDGAPSHFSGTARRYLDRRFPDRWIGRGGPIVWPPRSPDLNPLDFHLWGHLKSLVYSSPVPDLESLWNRIVACSEDMRNTPGVWDRVHFCSRYFFLDDSVREVSSPLHLAQRSTASFASLFASRRSAPPLALSACRRSPYVRHTAATKVSSPARPVGHAFESRRSYHNMKLSIQTEDLGESVEVGSLLPYGVGDNCISYVQIGERENGLIRVIFQLVVKQNNWLQKIVAREANNGIYRINQRSLPSKETLRGHSDSSFRGEGYIRCCVGVRLCDMYSNQELAEIHFMYGKADGNAALARRLYQERYPQRQCPDRKAFVVRLHYRLCEYGKFNSPGLGGGRPRSTTPKVQEEILEAVNMTPSISTRRVALQVNVPHTTVWRQLKEYQFYPYHLQRVQALSPADYPARVRFCQWFLQQCGVNPNFPALVLFTDKAQFTLDGITNFHNQHVWAYENPRATVPSHHQVRFSLYILTGQAYINFLEITIPHVLEDTSLINRQHIHFLHDGAPAHFSRTARRYLDRRFPDRWIDRCGPIAWPPRSPYLNPLDFYLWGHLKSLVYSSPVPDLESLRNRIVACSEDIRNTPGVWDRVRRSMRHRCEVCIQAGDGHFEHLL